MIIRIVTDEEIKNAYNSYTNGLSVEKVSKLFNIPQTSLRRYFKRKGYSIRSLSEAEKIYSFNESYFDGDGSIWSHLNKKIWSKNSTIFNRICWYRLYLAIYHGQFA